MGRMVHRLALAPLVLILALITTGDGHASHYRFSRIELVTRAEQRVLTRAGINDTRELLSWTASKRRRAWLAETTGLAYERLGTLATQCDLLRVDGVGPSMVEAFQQAGVRTTSDLAHAAPEELLTRLQAATAGTSLRYRLPTEDTLGTWIDYARHLRPLVEDLPPAP
ncbi:MAG: hypothetical protein CVU56_04740 [Deltaproteobacteria bacterium HGW-Deltaproteobacteria-14]|jgi:hypothetical protein|nr:MAG: hypothetical protein CVU56_04740 [Deltaproteobacteria bacterium HGW-Deltaproteobacteria-14]